MTPDQIIEVVTAFKNGKTIQFYDKVCNKGWLDANNPVWAFDKITYRVKPEPIELWVNVYNGIEETYVYETKAEALNCVGLGCTRKAVLFREVLGAGAVEPLAEDQQR